MVRSAVKFYALLPLIAILASCNAEKLDDLEQIRANEILPKITLDADFCTLDPEAIQSRLKFIFIVDKSGSNQTFQTELGSDVFGHRRYDGILDFIDQAPVDPTISYNIVNFGDNAWSPYGPNFVTKDTFANQVVAQKFPACNAGLPAATFPLDPLLTSTNGCPNDPGWTNYISAFGSAYSIISADIEAAKANPTEIVSSYYVIFFITDGAPIVGGSAAAGYVYQSNSNILGGVDALRGLAITEANRDYVEAIQVHSIYYNNGTDDSIAQSLLQTIASSNHGGGSFYQVNSGSNIDFNNFTIPQRNVKHVLGDLFVQNMNTAWWDGTLQRDLDADGIPDTIELTLGSNPAVYDSDQNGVGDGVEYTLFAEPCGALNCATSGAQLLNSCVSEFGAAPYGDRDGDNLNDCEEKLLGSSKTNADSNLDWIPDQQEYLSGIPFVSGQNGRNLDPDADGISSYQEIKKNSPAIWPNDRVINLVPYQYTLTMTDNTPTNSCFHLEVSDISVASTTDLIRLTVLENTSVIDNKRFFRKVDKRASGNTVHIDPGELP